MIYSRSIIRNADLYKAFNWRFWNLCSHTGTIGVVLPGNILIGKGSGTWRKKIIENGDFIEITQLVNDSKGWVFDGLSGGWKVALVSIRKTGQHDDSIEMRGAYKTLEAYKSGVESPGVELPAKGVLEWTEVAMFPEISNGDMLQTFLKIRSHPSLNDHEKHNWQFAINQGDYNAKDGVTQGWYSTKIEERIEGYWPVWGGSSFWIWNPDPPGLTGNEKGWCDPEKVIPNLDARRKKKLSSLSSLGQDWLDDLNTVPCKTARIAWRGVSSSSAARTLVVALIPPNTVLQNGAPFIVQSSNSKTIDAYLLGILSSVITDWYARRIILLNVNKFMVQNFPIPRLGSKPKLEAELITLSGRLASVDDRYEQWAGQVGVSVNSISAEDKPDVIARTNAISAHLYGLSKSDIEVIWSTFSEPNKKQDIPERDRVIHHFEELNR